MTSSTADTGPPGMLSGLAFDTFDVAGHLVDVGAPAGDVHETLRRLFRGFGPVTPHQGERPRFGLVAIPSGRWQVVAEGHAIRTGVSLPDALAALEWSMVTAAVAARRDCFHLHGASLRVPGQDAAIAITGASGSGKTTLVLALMAAGFEPYADDVILIEPETLAVEPFRRAFHVHDETWALLDAPVTLRAASDLPAGSYLPDRWAARSAPVRWLFALPSQRASAPDCRLLAPAEAAPAILRETLSLEPTPRLALAVTSRLTASARCYALTPGAPAATVAAINGIVAGGA